MNSNNKYYKNKKQIKKCKKLIIENGGKFEDHEFYENELYYEMYSLFEYGVSFSPQDNSIVFIDDQGDFGQININYYELLGFLMHHSFLGVSFKRI
jgi:hypothetical protein